jgi:hypothetical protein
LFACVFKQYGDTALTLAATVGHTFVKELVSGAKLDVQNGDGDSALILAARDGRTDVVKELTKAEANLNLQNNYGDTALMLAVSFRHKDIVDELVDKGANLDLQNQVSVPSNWCAVNYWHKQKSWWMLGFFCYDTCIQDPLYLFVTSPLESQFIEDGHLQPLFVISLGKQHIGFNYYCCQGSPGLCSFSTGWRFSTNSCSKWWSRRICSKVNKGRSQFGPTE